MLQAVVVEFIQNRGLKQIVAPLLGLVYLIPVFGIPATTALAQPPAESFHNGERAATCSAGLQVYESDRGKQLLGEVLKDEFPLHLPDWDEEFRTYQPAAEDVAALTEVKNDIDIICVLGTWCHDSQREVPRFWKILEETANPHLELTMFAVGRSSDEKALEILDSIGFDESLCDTYNVELVPTFIFMSDGVELGRIIESPQTTLEQDAALILSAEKPAQPGVKPGWN